MSDLDQLVVSLGNDGGRLSINGRPDRLEDQRAIPRIDQLLRALAALLCRVQVPNATTNRQRDELVSQLKLDLPVLDPLPDEGPLGVSSATGC